MLLTIFFVYKNDELKETYKFPIHATLVYALSAASYGINEHTIDLEIFDSSIFSVYMTDTVFWQLACRLLIQGSLAILLNLTIPVNSPQPYIRFLRHSILPFMLTPPILSVIGVFSSYMSVINIISILPVSALVIIWTVKVSLWIMKKIDEASTRHWQRVENFGLYFFLESIWTELRVPIILRTYCLLRLVLVVYQSWQLLSLPSQLSWQLLCSDTELLLVRSSETYIAILAMTSILSVICDKVGLVFQAILQSEDEEKSFAWVSAILFFILALQTGLPDLDKEKRFFQLCKNSCLLLTAILHFIHSLVDPYLISLANSTNNSNKHFRTLSVCTFLFVFPCILLYVLWSRYTMGTWLLAVTVFCIEAVVKVIVTVLIYGLTIWDVYYQQGLWESFDDWIFYIKSFGNVIQFLFAVFLFCNGGWVLLFESASAFRAFMMVIHAYYNIWMEAKNGWSTFWKRRTATSKVESLLDATPEQIDKHDDVCAICYQSMTKAKLTRCNHMFHNCCLTRWLHKQDTCPMCLEPLHKVDATSQTEEITINGQRLVVRMEEIPEPLDGGVEDE